MPVVSPSWNAPRNRGHAIYYWALRLGSYPMWGHVPFTSLFNHVETATKTEEREYNSEDLQYPWKITPISGLILILFQPWWLVYNKQFSNFSVFILYSNSSWTISFKYVVILSPMAIWLINTNSPLLKIKRNVLKISSSKRNVWFKSFLHQVS